DSQVTNVEITENKRKKISNRTNVKKKKENEEPCLTDSDNDITQAVGGSHSRFRIFKNIQPQSEQASNALSLSIRSPSPKNFYDQCFLTFKISQSPLAERHSSESVYSQLSPTPNVTSSSLTRNYLFGNTVNQWLLASTTSNTINVSSFSLIGPFKSDLEVCLYLVQHPALINLALSIINANGQESQIIDALMRSLFSDIQHAGVSECAALQIWVFGCYQDYNAALRHELRKLASEFIKKH
ncbi:12282_t:CDS:2, partial [Cetraspora pellucida]